MRCAAERRLGRRVAYTATAVNVTLDAKREGIDRILRAAYQMTGRAYMVLSGDQRGTLRVRLRPRRLTTSKGLERLYAAFETALGEGPRPQVDGA